MSAGYSFGKIILFGEHFVVYGLPAIVSAINKQAEIVVERKKEFPHELIDATKRFRGVPILTWQICHKPIEAVLKHLNIATPLRITLGGDLPIANSGIGSSAAHLVGLARALSEEFGLKLSDEQVNQTAFIGEKEIHGTPSGIDNTAATYGGLFLFKRNSSGKNLIKPIESRKPILIVIVESGVDTNTKQVVRAVRELKEKEPEKVGDLFNRYESLIQQAHEALEKNDLVLAGNLMNENHKLLQELTVSCPELDRMVEIARNAGALGAKLTGTGRGGLMVALTSGKDVQEKVADALLDAGYEVLVTSI
ncbi:mevalonate kinase [Candidatus Babeliales bacterium]|nr:mevalonate kinase [Candidatus Babeliales bacterium]